MKNEVPVRLCQPLPREGDPGSFGAQRRHDIHTGIDLYTDPKAAVFAIEDGTVIRIEDFTGPKADSPWWNDTKAVFVEGHSGVIVYGEIEPLDRVQEGLAVQAGDQIGHVVQVLKKDKGVNPVNMLHLELYQKGQRQSVWWKKDETRPENLKDPSALLENNIFMSPEFVLIDMEYKDKTAKRSGVPLINHIKEGIDILEKRGASLTTIKAYCLHPLIQSDIDLAKNAEKIARLVDPYALLLATEYRKTANAYLSQRTIGSLDDIELSPLPEVNEMLVADKIQNYKDFLIYHQKTHARSKELNEYFQNWLKKLDVDFAPYHPAPPTKRQTP